jgi:hypothetical protein
MEHFIADDDLPIEPPRKKPGRPVGSHKKRMNGAERKAFINESIKVVLDGHLSYTDYVDFCKTRDLSAPQANEYWLKIWAVIKKKFEMEKDKLILKHLQKYWEVYEQAKINGDLSNARQTLNDIAKMQGLAEPQKIEIKGTSIKLNFGDEESGN